MDEAEQKTVITINNLSFKYKKNEDLFDQLNLNMNAGVICGLLGKNGTGKTTLLRLMTGLLFAQEGDCKILSYLPQQRSPKFLQEIYFIPEEFYVPAVAVNTYVDLFSPFYPKFSKEDFFKFLKELGLTVDKKLDALSYGQKKKFLIAFALATNCKLLLLDEPTNGLDIPSKSCFRRLLAANLNEERTIIIATHQVRDLQNLLDTVVILDNGKIIFNHSLYEVANALSFTQQQDTKGLGNLGEGDIDNKDINADTNIADVVYAEKVLGGYMVVKKNQMEMNNIKNMSINDADYSSESEIDLEILFNAVINNREKIKAVFSGSS